MQVRLGRHLVAAFVVATSFAPPAARASLCVAASIEQRLDGSKVVFVGQVTEKRIENGEQVVVFLVVEPLKGVGPKESVTVRAETSKYMLSFEVGRELLVFAGPDARADGLRTHRCAGDVDMNEYPEAAGKTLADVQRVLRARGKHLYGRDPSIPDASVPVRASQPDAGLGVASPSVAPSGSAPPGAGPAPARSGGSGCTGCSVAQGQGREPAAWWSVVLALILVARRRARASGTGRAPGSHPTTARATSARYASTMTEAHDCR